MKRGDILLRPEKFGGIALHLPSERRLDLNHSAFFMLGLHLDPECHDPLAALAERYPEVEPQKLERDYQNLLHSFQPWLSGKDFDSDKVKCLPEIPHEPLSAPQEVFWEVTWRCNLRCLYCYNSSGQPTAEELSLDECQGLIDQWGELGVFKTIIGGGEPFMRQDILAILEMLEDKGITPIVISNGTLIDQPIAQRLKTMKRLRLSISLEGATAQVNDQVRIGDQAFDKALTGMAELRKAGVGFGLQAVLTQANLATITQLPSLAWNLGANSFSLRRLLPYGRAKEHHLTVGVPEIKRVVAQYEDLRSEYPEGFLSFPGLVPMDYAQDSPYCQCSIPPDKTLSCGPGYINCGLTPDGRLIPCSYLNSGSWLGPSVRELPFGDIWREGNFIQPMRDLCLAMLPALCQSCSHMEGECRGGCRASAFQAFGDWLAMDPECPYLAQDQAS